MSGAAAFYNDAADRAAMQPLLPGQQMPPGSAGVNKPPKKQTGSTAVKWILFWSLVLSAIWGPLVFGPAWHEKRFFGFGITTLDIRIGLMTMDWDVDCTSYFKESLADQNGRILGGRVKLRTPEGEFCRFMKLFQGQHSLRHARELACATRENFAQLPFRLDVGCDIFYRVYMGATFMLLGAGGAVLFHMIGFILLYYYWYVYAHQKLRMSALTLFFLGPLSSVTGMACYCLVGGDLGEIFKPMFSSMPFDPIREHEGISFGWCMVCAVVLTFFQLWIPLFFMCFIRVKKEEKMITNHDAYEEQIKLLLNDVECNTIIQEAAALNQKVQAQQQQLQAMQGYQSQASPPWPENAANVYQQQPGAAPDQANLGNFAPYGGLSSAGAAGASGVGYGGQGAAAPQNPPAYY